MNKRIKYFEKYLDSVRKNRIHFVLLFLVLLCILPLAGFNMWGTRYFSEPRIWMGGGLLNLAVCLTAYQINRRTAGFISGFYPDTHQSITRVACWFLLYAAINLSLTYVAVTLYDRLALYGYHQDTISALWLASSIIGGSLVGAGLTELFYAFRQWKTNQHELQQLEHKQLQTELEVVKQQVNPHFLFNCLNSLSVLIFEAPATAEKFVDEMSKVYRYLLSVNGADKENELVTLEAEMRFIRSYVYLLETRYEKGIEIKLRIAEPCLSGMMVPLTLQTLIDNAIRHNIVSTERPLKIHIGTTPTGLLEVSNNLQKRTVGMSSGSAGLATLISRYKLLFNQAGTIQVKQEESGFTVLLPLIYI